jgi:galacturan 1,4-alpha-galacturonidase
MAAFKTLALLLLSSVLPSLASGSPLPFAPPRPPKSNGKVCTLKPLGCERDDTPQILQAFEDCNNGGTVVFPEGETFYIASRLNPVISDVTVEWRGLWLVRSLIDHFVVKEPQPVGAIRTDAVHDT